MCTCTCTCICTLLVKCFKHFQERTHFNNDQHTRCFSDNYKEYQPQQIYCLPQHFFQIHKSFMFRTGHISTLSNMVQLVSYTPPQRNWKLLCGGSSIPWTWEKIATLSKVLFICKYHFWIVKHLLVHVVFPSLFSFFPFFGVLFLALFLSAVCFCRDVLARLAAIFVLKYDFFSSGVISLNRCFFFCAFHLAFSFCRQLCHWDIALCLSYSILFFVHFVFYWVVLFQFVYIHSCSAWPLIFQTWLSLSEVPPKFNLYLLCHVACCTCSSFKYNAHCASVLKTKHTFTSTKTIVLCTHWASRQTFHAQPHVHDQCMISWTVTFFISKTK